MLEAMGADDSHLGKHVRVGSAQILVFKFSAQNLESHGVLVKMKIPEPHPGDSDSDSEDRGIPWESAFYPNSLCYSDACDLWVLLKENKPWG